MTSVIASCRSRLQTRMMTKRGQVDPAGLNWPREAHLMAHEGCMDRNQTRQGKSSCSHVAHEDSGLAKSSKVASELPPANKT